MNVNCNFQQPFRMCHLQNHWITACDDVLSLPYIGPIQHVMQHQRWTKWYCHKFFSEFLPFSLPVIVPPLLHTPHHRSLQCDVLLTRKHFVTSSVFELGASSQLRHLAGCSELRFSNGGTRVWKSENSRSRRNGNVSVITVTYDVTSFSLVILTATSKRSMNRK